MKATVHILAILVGCVGLWPIAAVAQENPKRLEEMQEYRKVTVISSRARGQASLVLEPLEDKKKINISKIFYLKRDEGKTSLQNLGR